MLVYKFIIWKSCSKCGSLRTKIISYKEIGWGCDYDWSPWHGLCYIKHKVKVCNCCGDEFLQQQSAQLILGRALNKYVEEMILNSIKELDHVMDLENKKTVHE